jgi:hypothetical protein
MGCDIHLFIELKIDDRWEFYAHPDINRWYDFFGILAGVRSLEEPLVPPRGIPNDLSGTVKLYWKRWEADGHTPSWITTKEFPKLQKWLQQYKLSLEETIFNGVYFFDYSFFEWKEVVQTQGFTNLTDIRFVFWFDN